MVANKSGNNYFLFGGSISKFSSCNLFRGFVIIGMVESQSKAKASTVHRPINGWCTDFCLLPILSCRSESQLYATEKWVCLLGTYLLTNMFILAGSAHSNIMVRFTLLPSSVSKVPLLKLSLNFISTKMLANKDEVTLLPSTASNETN